MDEKEKNAQAEQAYTKINAERSADVEDKNIQAEQSIVKINEARLTEERERSAQAEQPDIKANAARSTAAGELSQEEMQKREKKKLQTQRIIRFSIGAALLIGFGIYYLFFKK